MGRLIHIFELKKGSKDYAYGSNKIIVSRLDSKLTVKNLNMKYKDGSSFKATVKDMSGKPLFNVTVKFTFKGKNYYAKTDAKGMAKLKINAKVGYYPIDTIVYGKYYTSDTITKKILVNGTKFVAKQAYASVFLREYKPRKNNIETSSCRIGGGEVFTGG